jgi:peptidyl-dipeptidase A
LIIILASYVRHKLHEFYGPRHINLSQPIPIHLLGNIWGQKWALDDIVVPYRGKASVDVTAEMVRQKFTPRKMFDMAESFFTSLNMTRMPPTFWAKSIIEKPADGRELVCHASAWDFYVDDDVRIKQCTRVTMENLITVHHELGHVEYYLHYRHQPQVFRTGANPGFHEAIGDVLALSVSTNRHLQRVGLLKDSPADQETEINALMRMALAKVAFLPFAFAMDKFRWEVFRGNVKPSQANCYFWELREKYGGVEPANVRTNRDFDITAKYHASADVEYLRYFVSLIIQFQFHKAACTKAGEYEPNNPSKTLSNCDIYQSVEAGNAMK